jgi:hypothetical protein
MISLLALKERPLGKAFQGIGPLGQVDLNISEFMELFNKVISNVVGFLTVIGGIWFIFQFIIGAFGWLTAGGDKAKVQTAQTKITHAIIGLAIIVAAVFLIDFIGNLLGLKILSPGEFIIGLWD